MKTGHIIAYLAPAWGEYVSHFFLLILAQSLRGQIKPLLVLIGRIAEHRSNAENITFTLLIGNGPMLQKVLQELERMPTSVGKHTQYV
jgi:hypothetical protein